MLDAAGHDMKIRNYASGFVYERYTDDGVDELQFFATETGRARLLNTGRFRLEHDLTDHLGNVRVSFAYNPETDSVRLLQEDSYYPFGLKMVGLSDIIEEENKFTYNGKELANEHGLNWYHYGARFYDPQLGRWHSVDPLDVEHGIYNYSFNSPINFTDPDGAKPTSTHIGKNGNVLAVYNDGDLGIYRHDIAASNYEGSFLSAANGTKIGSTLYWWSFTDYSKYDINHNKFGPKENVYPSGVVDVGSYWARDKVSWVLNSYSTIVDYGINARGNHIYDLKTHPSPLKYGKQVHDNYGSQLYKGIYVTSRNAGNFAAGQVAKRSLWSFYIIMNGYGAYNRSGNNISNIPRTLFDHWGDNPPFYGEDTNSGYFIYSGYKSDFN
ncbi:MAG: RHS repeat-associated core domain-containing protein [Bacteroidota bacterium]